MPSGAEVVTAASEPAAARGGAEGGALEARRRTAVPRARARAGRRARGEGEPPLAAGRAAARGDRGGACREQRGVERVAVLVAAARRPTRSLSERGVASHRPVRDGDEGSIIAPPLMARPLRLQRRRWNARARAASLSSGAACSGASGRRRGESGASSRSLGRRGAAPRRRRRRVLDAPTPAEAPQPPAAQALAWWLAAESPSHHWRRRASGTVHEAPLLLDAPAVGARHALKSGDREPREREPPENGTGCRPCSRGRFAPGPPRDVPSSPWKPASCAASDPDNTLPSGFGGRFAERGDASCAGSSLSPCEPPLISMFASSSSRSSARTGGGFFILGVCAVPRGRDCRAIGRAAPQWSRNSYPDTDKVIDCDADAVADVSSRKIEI